MDCSLRPQTVCYSVLAVVARFGLAPGSFSGSSAAVPSGVEPRSRCTSPASAAAAGVLVAFSWRPVKI